MPVPTSKDYEVAGLLKMLATDLHLDMNTVIRAMLRSHPLFDLWAPKVVWCTHCARWLPKCYAHAGVPSHRIRNPDQASKMLPEKVRPFWITCPGSHRPGPICNPTPPALIAIAAHMQHHVNTLDMIVNQDITEGDSHAPDS